MQTLDETVIGSVEVFGAWEGACVISTIVHGLKKGWKVRVPKGFTVMPYPSEGYDLKRNVPSYNEHMNGPKLQVSEDEEFIYFDPVK